MACLLGGDTRGSAQLAIGRLDHFAPFLGVRFKELGKIGWRAWEHGADQVGKPRPQFRINKAGTDLLVEPPDGEGSSYTGMACR
jgi:hypothetical protein